MNKKERNNLSWFPGKHCFGKINKFHCSLSLSLSPIFNSRIFKVKSYTRQELNNIFVTSIPRLVIPILKNRIVVGEKKFLPSRLLEGNAGAANSAKRLASGTTIGRMKAPIINSITRTVGQKRASWKECRAIISDYGPVSGMIEADASNRSRGT